MGGFFLLFISGRIKYTNFEAWKKLQEYSGFEL